MAHVFISYSHEDFEFAENLQLRLRNEGFETWMDEERLTAGEDWREEIDAAIKDSFAFLLILTPKALESRYVTYEWSFAWGAGKKVIPLLLSQVEDDKLHPRLDRRQYLDFMTRKGRQWVKLFDLLKKLENSYKTTLEEVRALESVNDTNNTEKPNPIVLKLLKSLTHEQAAVRVGAIKTLRQFNDNVTIDSLVEMLHDSSNKVREEAAISLGEMQRGDIPFALQVTLNGDEDNTVRATAAHSLGLIATEEAISGLLDALLNDNDIYVRESCINAISGMQWSIADKRHVSPLVQYLLNCEPFLEEQNDLNMQLEGKTDGLTYALSLMNTRLRLREVTAELNLCEKVISVLQEIGTPEALAAVEEWRRKQQS